ncbi:MAG: hypothetical protein ACE5I7_02820 [Candidatus Binatia bacterium]
MKALVVLALGGLLSVAAPARAAQPAIGPHHAVKPNGELNMGVCAFCHDPDMKLSRSKVETCTLCHAVTIHSGAAEHLGASPADVARLLGSRKDGAPDLPLTESGGMYCGTCHLFHDPALGGQKPLPQAWVPPSSGLPQAVRAAVAARWGAIAHKYGASGPAAKFATKSTRNLRLPVDDGSLCRHCHKGIAR